MPPLGGDQDARTCRRAARGPYWPQDGHAVCGRCFSRQAGFAQVTSVGTDAFHWDRRCRVLLRDILRLGTATVLSLLSRRRRDSSNSPCCRCELHLYIVAMPPSRVPSPSTGPAAPPTGGRSRPRGVSGIVVQAGAALGAQPRAVLRAQRLERQVEHHVVAEQRLEVDEVALQPADLVLGGLAVGVDEQLLDVDLQRAGDRGQAAHALPARPPPWRCR